MYEPYQNIICVNQNVFYENLALLSYGNFQKHIQRGKLNRLRTAGNGRCGLIEFKSIPEELQQIIIKSYGNPWTQEDRETFTSQIEPDQEAINFFLANKEISEVKKKQHICEAEILDLYNRLITADDLNRKVTGRKSNKGALKTKLCMIIAELKLEKYPNSTTKKYPHNLPSNVRALDRKLKGYLSEGYSFLPHKNKGNSSAAKIKGNVANWLLAQYSMPNKIVVPVLHTMYMSIHEQQKWPALDESTIYKWLHQPEQERQWTISRDGMDVFRRKFGHKLVRDKDQYFPNAYWAIDGTKLDWLHYQDDSLGMGAKLKIDPVFDIYSEKILGWSYSETENHVDHFQAVKMAVENSQSRPYMFTYDKQSGHTSKIMQGLYNKLVAKQGGTHFSQAAYRHGSPIEQLFNRFQQQVLNKWFWSDKQGIKVRTDKNRPNMDFVLDNKHKFLTKDQLIKAWELSVNEWNEAKHPKFKKSRNAVYNEEPLMQEVVSHLEMIDMFWVFSTERIKYKKDGIKPTIAKQDYHFEVYNDQGEIDLEFRKKYVGQRFFVRYDPTQMDNYISLYIQLPNGEKQHIANAEPVRKHQQIPVLMKEGDKAQWAKDFEIRKTEEKAAKAAIKQVQQETGITPEKLIDDQLEMLKFGGKLKKEDRSFFESESFLNRM